MSVTLINAIARAHDLDEKIPSIRFHTLKHRLELILYMRLCVWSEQESGGDTGGGSEYEKNGGREIESKTRQPGTREEER